MAQIASEQPTRLLDEAVQPLEAQPLHPVRRALHVAADEAQADPPRAGQRRPQRGDQPLLLRCAERHVHHVGGRRHQVASDRLDLLDARRIAHARRGEPRDAQRGMERVQASGGALGGAGCAAEQIVRAPFRGRPGGDRPHQVRARHARRQGGPAQPRRPHERHAVGHHHLGVAVQVDAIGPPVVEQVVDVRGDDPAAAPGAQRLHHVVQQLGLVDRGERQPIEHDGGTCEGGTHGASLALRPPSRARSRRPCQRRRSARKASSP